MVPVLWDIGHDVSRNPPFALTPELSFVLDEVHKLDDGSSVEGATR
jgi:hypothetical protein